MVKGTVELLLLATIFYVGVRSQKDPNFVEGHDTIVHLFEWKWKDIAKECERFLGKKGFGGVQVSPPNENLIIGNRPWYERYQSVSYKLVTRSGDEADFRDMVRRCANVGVRIYVDSVINHMTGGSGRGTAGNSAQVDANTKNYPGVPYTTNDFHPTCSINDWNNPVEIRNCELVGLKDLDQSRENVRTSIINFLNHLIDLGVAGFRIDAAKHMWPSDLENIFGRLKNLNTDYGFKNNSRALVYQEVIDWGGEGVHREDYLGFGRVLEFKYGKLLSNVFRGNDKLKYLVNWGPEWGLLSNGDGIGFIDNHDNQRSEASILSYKTPKQYKMAVAFMLAHPYGVPRIMSSFFFDDKDQPPPQDNQGNIISPSINEDGTCGNGWVCEHRWREIYKMVTFRNVVSGTEIKNWWSNNDQQISFSRGSKGFVAFNQWGDLNQRLQTGLPEGTYCDVISGDLLNLACTGKSVVVNGNGYGQIIINSNELDGVLAIHVGAKLR